MSRLANLHARQSPTQSYAQGGAQKLKMRSLKISFVNKFARCFDHFGLMLLLVCQRHWLVQRHGRLAWRGLATDPSERSRGWFVGLLSVIATPTHDNDSQEPCALPSSNSILVPRLVSTWRGSVQFVFQPSRGKFAHSARGHGAWRWPYLENVKT